MWQSSRDCHVFLEGSQDPDSPKILELLGHFGTCSDWISFRSTRVCGRVCRTCIDLMNKMDDVAGKRIMKKICDMEDHAKKCSDIACPLPHCAGMKSTLERKFIEPDRKKLNSNCGKGSLLNPLAKGCAAVGSAEFSQSGSDCMRPDRIPSANRSVSLSYRKPRDCKCFPSIVSSDAVPFAGTARVVTVAKALTANREQRSDEVSEVAQRGEHDETSAPKKPRIDNQQPSLKNDAPLLSVDGVTIETGETPRPEDPIFIAQVETVSATDQQLKANLGQGAEAATPISERALSMAEFRRVHVPGLRSILLNAKNLLSVISCDLAEGDAEVNLDQSVTVRGGGPVFFQRFENAKAEVRRLRGMIRNALDDTPAVGECLADFESHFDELLKTVEVLISNPPKCGTREPFLDSRVQLTKNQQRGVEETRIIAAAAAEESCVAFERHLLRFKNQVERELAGAERVEAQVAACKEQHAVELAAIGQKWEAQLAESERRVVAAERRNTELERRLLAMEKEQDIMRAELTKRGGAGGNFAEKGQSFYLHRSRLLGTLVAFTKAVEDLTPQTNASAVSSTHSILSEAREEPHRVRVPFPPAVTGQQVKNGTQGTDFRTGNGADQRTSSRSNPRRSPRDGPSSPLSDVVLSETDHHDPRKLHVRINKPICEPDQTSLALGEDALREIAGKIKDGSIRKVVIIAGAGISTAAGIPDFRTPGTGLYDNLKAFELPYPEAVFDVSFFEKNPKPFFAVAKGLLPGGYQPTVSHYFIKLLESEGLLRRLYSQNIDNLELSAGIRRDLVVQTHGSFATGHCVKCRSKYSFDWLKERIVRDEIPTCVADGCGKIVKPDIVFFHEQLPPRYHALHRKDLRDVDMLMVVGTSLSVAPVCDLVTYVPPKCHKLLINNEMVAGAIFGGSGNAGSGFCGAYLGDCDAAFQLLADFLGWTEKLRKLTRASPAPVGVSREDRSVISRSFALADIGCNMRA